MRGSYQTGKHLMHHLLNALTEEAEKESDRVKRVLVYIFKKGSAGRGRPGIKALVLFE